MAPLHDRAGLRNSETTPEAADSHIIAFKDWALDSPAQCDAHIRTYQDWALQEWRWMDSRPLVVDPLDYPVPDIGEDHETASRRKGEVLKLIVGKSGRRWFYNDDFLPGAREYFIYSDRKGVDGQLIGSGGPVEFYLVDGTTLSLEGPWRSNASDLFADTGIDLRDNESPDAAPPPDENPDAAAPGLTFQESDAAAPEFKTPEPDETTPAFSEDSLALVFTGRHGATLRYVAKWGRWLIYDGKKWNFDETLKTFSLARQICRNAAGRVNKLRDAKAIASAKTRSAVVSLASSDERHAATTDQWDADPWLLNTPDGVIDLRTGKQRPHRAADYMTKMCAVTPDAKCPTLLWDAFLITVTGNDVELQRFLQRMSGYGLTGVTIEHALFFLYGTGANGKGVFINTVAGVMGDYHKTAPLETFTASDSERHPTDLAMLQGARTVTVTETEAGKRWSESRIKVLTGGDPIQARFMRQDFFSYMPQFKLMISGNHRPGLNSVNEAIRRRVNMLPFNVTIPEAQRDKDLTEKLKAEWPGILAWMIEGCLEWQKNGLQPPQVVKDATDEYLKSEDKLGRWIEECLKRDPNGWASSTDLFYSWKQWAEDNGEWVGSQTKLSTDLTDAGFRQFRKTSGMGYIGLQLDAVAGFVVAGGCNAPKGGGAGGKNKPGVCQNPAVCERSGTCQFAKS